MSIFGDTTIRPCLKRKAHMGKHEGEGRQEPVLEQRPEALGITKLAYRGKWGSVKQNSFTKSQLKYVTCHQGSDSMYTNLQCFIHHKNSFVKISTPLIIIILSYIYQHLPPIFLPIETACAGFDSRAQIPLLRPISS